MSDGHSTSPISVPNSQLHQLRETLGASSDADPNVLSSRDKRCTASQLPTSEAVNWIEALRSLAGRDSSIGGSISSHIPQPTINQPGQHQRTASVAIKEQPDEQVPKKSKQNMPDFFQEKILRGDFME